MPNNCVPTRNCRAVVTAVVLDGDFQFELKSGESKCYIVNMLHECELSVFS